MLRSERAAVLRVAHQGRVAERGRGDVAMLRDEPARRGRAIVRAAHGSERREVRVEVAISIAFHHAVAIETSGAQSAKSDRERSDEVGRGGR